MNSNPFKPSLFHCEELGGITLIRFHQEMLTEEINIDQLKHELTAVLEQTGNEQMIVSLKNVVHITSSVLGNLIHLHRHLQRLEGNMALCELTDNVIEIMKTSRLDTYFSIYPGIEDVQVSWSETGS